MMIFEFVLRNHMKLADYLEPVTGHKAEPTRLSFLIDSNSRRSVRNAACASEKKLYTPVSIGHIPIVHIRGVFSGSCYIKHCARNTYV